MVGEAIEGRYSWYSRALELGPLVIILVCICIDGKRIELNEWLGQQAGHGLNITKGHSTY
jgi:hypothetical protein